MPQSVYINKKKITTKKIIFFSQFLWIRALVKRIKVCWVVACIHCSTPKGSLSSDSLIFKLIGKGSIGISFCSFERLCYLDVFGKLISLHYVKASDFD